MLKVNKLVHVGSGIIMDDQGRFITDVSARMATFVAIPIAEEIVRRYNMVEEKEKVE